MFGQEMGNLSALAECCFCLTAVFPVPEEQEELNGLKAARHPQPCTLALENEGTFPFRRSL